MSDSKKPKAKSKDASLLRLSASKHQTSFRRCHICESVNECDGHDVKRCETCGKSMAPFYFFNDVEVVPHSDAQERPARPPGKVRPVLGFTAYW